jgi:ElaB/YqjD/DUF883 family membrane-anchored ribosome-binding protein
MSKHHNTNQQAHHATRNGAKGRPKQAKDAMQSGPSAERNEERSSSSGLAGEMVERLQDGTAAVVGGISELAGSLKEEAVQDLAAAKEVVGETVDKVGEVIKDAQDAVVDAGEAVVASVKRNPMPAALAGFGLLCAGAGVTWMVMSSKSSASGARRPNGQGRARANGNGETDNGSARPRSSSVSKATQAAGRKLKDAGEGISTRGRQLGRAAQKTMRDNPLAAGATLAAVGAALGLAIPITRKEDEWLGEGRDEIVDKAEELARGAISKVENVTKAVRS